MRPSPGTFYLPAGVPQRSAECAGDGGSDPVAAAHRGAHSCLGAAVCGGGLAADVVSGERWLMRDD